MRKLIPIAVVTLAVWAFAGSASAGSFGFSGWGGKLGYASPDGLEGTLHVGGHLEFEAADTRLHIIPSVLFWKSEDVSDVNPNLDVYYHFESQGTVTPYLGGGLGIHAVNDDRFNVSDTNLGANLFGGVRIPGSFNHYFIEGRYAATDASTFSLLGGITFH